MKCAHCLRGAAQKKDQTKENIDTLFSQVSYISDITFTGGEPSLVPEILEYALESAKRYHVGVGSFYIATNGKNITEDFVIACLRWYAYCDNNEGTGVHLSQDDFHDAEGQDNYELLKGLSFFNYRRRTDSHYVIPEGRAKGWEWTCGEKVRKEIFEIEEEVEGFSVLDGAVYLNCKGELIGGCDWSYRNQTKNKICDVDSITLEAFEDFGADIEYLNA